MKLRSISHKNITYYARYYRLAAVAIVIAIMVIVGSLLVGHSVQSTLVNRVNERLGKTQTVVFTQEGFLSENFVDAPVFEGSARGVLLTNGVISVYGRLIPVSVWGVDDLKITIGGVKINEPLQREIGENNLDALVLRLPASGLIPQRSLFVTESYTSSMRLSYEGKLTSEDGGNISLKNEQILPLNVFVNRSELAEVMETEGKINLILTDKKITEDQVYKVWDYKVSGLQATSQPSFTEVFSDRVFLPYNAK